MSVKIENLTVESRSVGSEMLNLVNHLGVLSESVYPRGPAHGRRLTTLT